MPKPKKVEVLIKVEVSFGDYKGEVVVPMVVMSNETILRSHQNYNGCFEGLKAAVARFINSHLKDS